jgi:hypothetical protein
MKSSKEILANGRFRPNRLMKAQLWEDQQAASEGKLGLTEAQKEQVSQEAAAAAAQQAAQAQTEVSRSMMGQPDFVGQKAQFSAGIAQDAAAQAGAGRAAANQMSQTMALQKKAMIDERLQQLANRRYNTGMWAAQTSVNLANEHLLPGIGKAKTLQSQSQQNPTGQAAGTPPYAS